MQEYIDADQRLHLLCQVLAKVTANLIPEKEDYSHTNLLFESIGNRILTRWMNGKDTQICLAVNLPNFSFQWLDQSMQKIKETKISGNTYLDLVDALKSQIHEIGIGDHNLDIDLKYEIEDYPFKTEAFRELSTVGLNKWLHYRKLANESCYKFLNYINAAGEVRIWPHHFDTGVYTEIDNQLGLDFGLAVKDNLVNGPYIYLSGYPMHGELNMDNLSDLPFGRWETGSWKGALLPLQEIVVLSKDKRVHAIDQFQKIGIEWYLSSDPDQT